MPIKSAPSEAVAAPDPGDQRRPNVDALRTAIGQCRLCAERPAGRPLPHGPRPILRLSATARMAVASQAPGARAHASGVPFDDASGARLRAWLGLDHDTFHDRDRLAIVPMGFCFPGYDAKGGDKPPRLECRRTWHDDVFAAMPQLELLVCVGVHAIRYQLARLGRAADRPVAMSDVMARWRTIAAAPHPRVFPLPHPSWRNTAWLRRNPWFQTDVLPALREAVSATMAPACVQAEFTRDKQS